MAKAKAAPDPLEFMCSREELRLVMLYGRGLLCEQDLLTELQQRCRWSEADALDFMRLVVEARWASR